MEQNFNWNKCRMSSTFTVKIKIPHFQLTWQTNMKFQLLFWYLEGIFHCNLLGIMHSQEQQKKSSRNQLSNFEGICCQFCPKAFKKSSAYYVHANSMHKEQVCRNTHLYLSLSVPHCGTFSKYWRVKAPVKSLILPRWWCILF